MAPKLIFITSQHTTPIIVIVLPVTAVLAPSNGRQLVKSPA